MDQTWVEIARLVRAYAQEKYGQLAVGVSIHLLGQQHAHYEPLPLGAAPAPPKRTPGRWDSGAEPREMYGYRSVYWPGLGTFHFPGEKQRAVIIELWDAWKKGRPDVPQAELLRKADSDGTRLLDLFKDSPAWGTLIVRGRAPASYRLAGLPEGEGEAVGAEGGEEGEAAGE